MDNFHQYPKKPLLCLSLKYKVTRRLPLNPLTHLVVSNCLYYCLWLLPTHSHNYPTSFGFHHPNKTACLHATNDDFVVESNGKFLARGYSSFLKHFHLIPRASHSPCFSTFLIWCPLVFFTGFSYSSVSMWESQDNSLVYLHSCPWWSPLTQGFKY